MIAMGDVISRKIMSEQRWDLSNSHFLMSSLFPVQITRGAYNSFASGTAAHFDKSRPVKFPGWLGHNSTITKNRNCVASVMAEGGIRGGSRAAVLEYFPLLRNSLSNPFLVMEKSAAVKCVIEVMDTYRLRRDDWDSIMEITGVAGRLPAPEVPSVVKGAFTREFNKTHQMTSMAKGLGKRLVVADDTPEGGMAEDDNDEDDGGEDGEAPPPPRAEEKSQPTAKKRKK